MICGMSNKEAAARYRRRMGANVGGPRGPKPTAVCGTLSAYSRHRRHGEDPCDACAEAARAYYADRRAKQREALRPVAKVITDTDVLDAAKAHAEATGVELDDVLTTALALGVRQLGKTKAKAK